MEYTHGYLELGIGCMFSGKTTWLLEIYRKFTYCKTNVVVINHVEDTRYDPIMLSSHDKVMIPCIQLSGLDDISEESLCSIMAADVVLINEGQFFETIVPFVKRLLVARKMVYICGLDGDFKQQRFGHILDLIPICDKVRKLSALCADCKNGARAIFSHRVISDTQQKVIGTDNYIPLCRKCLYVRTESGCEHL